ncbi:regulator of (H+)-ATPase in vacuolar membrane [Malassezia vespertilionis]|uniref:regulator of (H+)-ATPase in vacuolar membrane n=1 Tax=Malassezia vespertilionis TaxID=2020962 RepID=UPI0024B1AA56|nr:regulator of (H+)-ATPase in vacuolar membrane [Malassezia vespertilionis]WFD05059.1 regulator of (H+)-ATPase in vacuolar membrane [Malassezia vespertilionis]
MSDVLPTLTREWASLGASHAPRNQVEKDSPRIPAALNTFASLVLPEKDLYMRAQASGRQVNVLLGRGEEIQCLLFDRVPGTRDLLQHARVRSVALGTDAHHSDTILLAASFQHLVAIWRLVPTQRGTSRLAPAYAGWHLDSTFPIHGELITSLDILNGTLVVGGTNQLSVWDRQKSGMWHKGFSYSVRRPVLCARWSPDGSYLAAAFLRACRLDHARPVQDVSWRQARPQHEQHPVLVVLAENCAAYIYSTVVDEPIVLRQWAAVDASTDPGLESTNQVLALLYCDAYRLSIALQHDIDRLAYLLQVALTGVHAELDTALLAAQQKRLEQLLAQAPDLFFAMMADGSLGVYALMNLESSTPMLLNTYIMLRLPFCIAIDGAQTPLMLQFLPLPYKKGAHGTAPVSTGIIRAQSANGLRGMATVSLALLFDGDPEGILVQDSIIVSEAVHCTASTRVSFLRVEHKADILGLYVSPSARSMLSFSADGVLLGWHLHAHGLVSQHKVQLRRARLACILGKDSRIAVVVGNQLSLVLAGAGDVHFAHGTDSQITAELAMESCDLPGDAVQCPTRAFGSFSQGEHAIVLLTDEAVVYVWHTKTRGETRIELQAPQRTELCTLHTLGRVQCAALVSAMELRVGTRDTLCTLDEHGALDFFALHAKTWQHCIRLYTQRSAEALAVSTRGQAALAVHDAKQWHISIWDAKLATFCNACVYDASFDGERDQVPALAWGSSRSGTVLAVAIGAHIRLIARTSLPGKAVQWALLAEVHLGAGAARIAHLAWLDGLRLIAASTCQLFLFHAFASVREDASEALVPLDLMLAQRHAMLPVHHPSLLAYCLQCGLLRAAQAILLALHKRLDAPAELPMDTFLQQHDGPMHFDKEMLDAVRHTLQDKSAEHGTNFGLLDAAEALSEPVDLPGQQYLVLLYQHSAAILSSDPSHVPTGALALWAYLSDEQSILLGRARAVCENKMQWAALRAAGVFTWCRDRALLVPLMEHVARASYTSADNADPVQSTLFYLALGRLSTVRSMWRRAVGHPDKDRMTRLLANDFSVKRWRVAAQKNAFVLMSQRRFQFAAALFLLGGATRDAVNVCVRNLHDVWLAIAIARMHEADDYGPVFCALLRQHIVPMAINQGDRWLGCWALYVLKEFDTLLRMILAPMHDVLVHAGNAFGHLEDRGFAGYSDVQDPALLRFFAYCKGQAWIEQHTVSGQLETQFVLFCNDRWREMGCDYIGVSALVNWRYRVQVEAHSVQPPASAQKLTSLVASSPSPSSAAQGAQAFDLGAFDF